MPRHALLALLVLPAVTHAQESTYEYIRNHYTRQTVKIPARDGVKLHTIIYSPKDGDHKYPIMLRRTPYGIAPYEDDKMPGTLGPNSLFVREKYIFVYQDVRGRFMSEGEFENMRPHRPVRKSVKDIDESTDTFDTIDWLIKHVENHNGKVGLQGISYPGFYCSAGMIDHHPALVAVSPQAPIADWFFDDFNHHGAFFLSHAYGFFPRFGKPRPELTTKGYPGFTFPTPDGYKFFLETGTMKNLSTKYLQGKYPFWDTMAAHPNYDKFWKERNLLPHLKNVAPAVMTVGGWYDAEDLYGIFNTYQTVEKQNPGIFNILVVGPWSHGGWSRAGQPSLGDIHFGVNPNPFFQKDVELAFFNHFLKGRPKLDLPEALMFETGKFAWQRFDHWPPKDTKKVTWHFGPKQTLGAKSEEKDGFDEFVSDPRKPVPYTAALSTGMRPEYMTDDQRFASRRPDVLNYMTEALGDEVTLAGPLDVTLKVSTTGTDADWVVKLIDVYPPDYRDPNQAGKPMGGYERMIRSEVIRGRFRNSFEKPAAFEPGKVETVKLRLLDVLHTFKKGHRVMIQVCSSWFPLIDRNPQTFVPNIFEAKEGDFRRATHRVYRSAEAASGVEVGILPAKR